MSFKIANLEMFEGTEGFHFRKDLRGNYTDVTLPPNYEIISKNITYGQLTKIEFRDSDGQYYLFKD